MTVHKSMLDTPEVKAAAAVMSEQLRIGKPETEAFIVALKYYLRDMDCGLVANSAIDRYR